MYHSKIGCEYHANRAPKNKMSPGHNEFLCNIYSASHDVHTCFVGLCFVFVKSSAHCGFMLFTHPYPTGLLRWYWDNHMRSTVHHQITTKITSMHRVLISCDTNYSPAWTMFVAQHVCWIMDPHIIYSTDIPCRLLLGPPLPTDVS